MQNKKLIPHRIAPHIYKELENIVGREWISQDRAVLETYSKLSLDAEGFLKKFHGDAFKHPCLRGDSRGHRMKCSQSSVSQAAIKSLSSRLPTARLSARLPLTQPPSAFI